MEFETAIFKEVGKAFLETDKRMKEMSAEADRQMKKMSAEADRRREETDRQMKETDQKIKENAAQMKKTDKKLRDVSKNLGRLGNALGFFVQEMVRPGLVRLMRERGVDVHRTYPNVEIDLDDAGAAEFDLIAANGEDVVIVEVKNKLKIEDIHEHIERIGKVRTLLPEYRNHKIMAAVAGMTVAKNAAAYAEKQGLFVIAPSGDDVTLLNAPSFEPKIW